jgi:hypothetical protein
MNTSVEEMPVLSLTPGRVRLHLPDCATGRVDAIEDLLSRLRGVENVHVNRRTGNALIHFDPRTTDEKRLLAGLQKKWQGLLTRQERVNAPRSKTPARDGIRVPVARRVPATSSLLRIGVRGLLGHAVVDSVWFAAGFLGASLGLPLAGLGPLHILMDFAVWGMALKSGSPHSRLPAS